MASSEGINSVTGLFCITIASPCTGRSMFYTRPARIINTRPSAPRNTKCLLYTHTHTHESDGTLSVRHETFLCNNDTSPTYSPYESVLQLERCIRSGIAGRCNQIVTPTTHCYNNHHHHYYWRRDKVVRVVTRLLAGRFRVPLLAMSREIRKCSTAIQAGI